MKLCFDITLQDVVGTVPEECKSAITDIMDSLEPLQFLTVMLLIQLAYGRGKLDGVIGVKQLQKKGVIVYE